jgi:hypothetical protein
MWFMEMGLGSKLARGGLVMFKSMPQLDWTTRCRDVWINIISGCAHEGVPR